MALNIDELEAVLRLRDSLAVEPFMRPLLMVAAMSGALTRRQFLRRLVVVPAL